MVFVPLCPPHVPLAAGAPKDPCQTKCLCFWAKEFAGVMAATPPALFPAIHSALKQYEDCAKTGAVTKAIPATIYQAWNAVPRLKCKSSVTSVGLLLAAMPPTYPAFLKQDCP